MGYHFDWKFIFRNLDFFFSGLQLTVLLSVAAIVGSLLWGIIVVIFMSSRNKMINDACRGYIEVSRNTPLLVQMFIFFYGIPMLGFNMSVFWCGAGAIISQYGGYVAETLRGGIAGISQKQTEAARALGFSRSKSLLFVIIPQALVKTLPPIGNLLVDIVEWTSLGAAIGIMELTLTGRVLAERSAAVFEVFLTVGFIYLILTSLMTTLLKLLERRWNYF